MSLRSAQSLGRFATIDFVHQGHESLEDPHAASVAWGSWRTSRACSCRLDVCPAQNGLGSTLSQRCRLKAGWSGGTAQNQPDRRFLSAVSAGTRFSWRGWRYRRRRSRSASGPESSASSDHGMALRGCRSRCMAPPSEVRSSRNLCCCKGLRREAFVRVTVTPAVRPCSPPAFSE